MMMHRGENYFHLHDRCTNACFNSDGEIAWPDHVSSIQEGLILLKAITMDASRMLFILLNTF
jgi:hypothetical protein